MNLPSETHAVLDRPTRAPRTTTAARWARVGYATLVLVSLAWTFVYVRFTVDDAFITWRYGQTLVESGQWNWQPGTPRVEAYTNPAYAAASIIPALVHLSPELFFKLVSTALVLGLVGYVFRLTLPTWQRLVLLALVLVNPVFWIHLWSGLETPLLVITIVIVYGELHTRGRLGSLGLVAVVLLAMSRPEGFGYALAAAVWSAAVQRNRRALIESSVIVVGLLGYWLARAAWFGAWFPNTFYVKTAHAVRHEGFVLATLLAGLAVLGVLVVGASVGEVARRWGRGTQVSPFTGGAAAWTPVVLMGLSAGVAVGLYGNSTLSMNFGDRFYWQVVAPVVLVSLTAPLTRTSRVPASLALMGAAAITLLVPPYTQGHHGSVLAVVAVLGAALVWWGRTPRATAVGAAIAAVAAMAATSLVSRGELLYLATYQGRADYAHGALARVLADSAATHRTLSMTDVGKAPLLSRWRTIDVYGLANREVTMRRTTVPVLRRWKPSVVIFTSTSARPPRPTTGRIEEQPLRYALHHGYAAAGVFEYTTGYFLHVFVSPGIDNRTRARLEAAARDSRAENDMSDGQWLRAHPLDFPFLRGIIR